ncbi:hypothetical protein [Pseudomonas sp. NPDC089401]|uniref:hypothetical protein n=1 Tax=Pseudomonas sp. NPDC089401 TaxID=3364462 RepID=UPI003803FE96
MIESAEEFVRLRSSENKDEYDRSAFEEASLETWNKVIDEYPDYACWVAFNKSVPLEILERLSDSADDRTRTFVATKRKLSKELFDKMSRDKSSVVRGRIAVNKKTPMIILQRLLSDPSESVVEAARYNLERRS